MPKRESEDKDKNFGIRKTCNGKSRMQLTVKIKKPEV